MWTPLFNKAICEGRNEAWAWWIFIYIYSTEQNTVLEDTQKKTKRRQRHAEFLCKHKSWCRYVALFINKYNVFFNINDF